MKIQLSDHFTYKKLLRFVLPSIIMMIFTSIYSVIDGIFVSNFVGKTAFAAINLIMPFLMIFGSLGFMIGTGGSALVSMTIGKGDKDRANKLFSMLIYITIGLGIILSIIGLIFLNPMAKLLGAKGDMLRNCVTYGRIILPMLTAYMLQNVFQSFMVTAEKPHLGMNVTIIAGVTNIILDALFVAVFKWGLIGAAVATIISQAVGGLIPLVYFFMPNNSLLCLTKTRFDGKAFVKTCVNGSSELMTNISMSIVNILYNYQLLRLIGEDGVAAFGVIMYLNFIFISIFLGYSIGSAPIVGYNYGAENTIELKGLFKKSLIIIGVFGISITVLAEVLANPLAHIFVGYDTSLFELTKRGFMIYSISFILAGFNIYGSGFFTALNNGVVSAGISFMRTLVFQIASIIFIPMIFHTDGIWLAIVVAEFLSMIVTTICFIKMRKQYNYV